MDGAERMLSVTAGRDIECPLMGDDAVPQHDNRNGEPNLHVHKVLLNRAVRDRPPTSDLLPSTLASRRPRRHGEKPA